VYFSAAKDLGEIPTGSPQQGRQIELGYVQISDCRPIAIYLRNYRDILWKANRNSYALYRMVLFSLTLSDPQLPQTTPCLTFYIAFHIVVMGGDRDLKVGRQVDHSNC